MSKGQMLRVLVKQRLTAAAEEIFGLFERTIAEYEEELCRSKEENERQRELLDAVFKPQLRLHRADVQHLSVSEEEVPSEQQDWSPSLDQEDPPETPHIKEEQEELWTSQEGEQLQELEFTSIPFPVKSEDDNKSSQLLQIKQMEAEPAGEDCGAARNWDPERQPDTKECCKQTDESDGWTNTQKLEKALNSLKNGKVSLDDDDVRCKAGSKRFSCFQCGKTFRQEGNLKRHMGIHTGERPFSCSVCAKRFSQNAHLQNHLKSHTGDKPYSCLLCEKRFTRNSYLRTHVRTHTGEKLFSCKICYKRFTWHSQLKRHKCIVESSKLHDLWANQEHNR